MTFKAILVEKIPEKIAVITFDRPSAGNSINEQMAFELRDACSNLNLDDDVWVVILSGSGNSFCCGTDPSELERPGGLVQNRHTLAVAGHIAAINKPVVAVLNGDVLDQGLELALACDIRIASSRARLGLTQVTHQLMPWDGGTQRLARLVGQGRAVEMILASRIVGAEEALEMGMVSQIAETTSDALREARELASTIVRHGPVAARYVKEAVLKGIDMTLEQGLRLETDLNVILQSTNDRTEGLRSFLERRSPDYRGD